MLPLIHPSRHHPKKSSEALLVIGAWFWDCHCQEPVIKAGTLEFCLQKGEVPWKSR
jgi:hypothetical protein